MAQKFNKMARFVPGLFRPMDNPHMRGLLYAWSSEDDNLVEAVKDAKEQIFVKLAQLQYLDALGSNVGVFRPTEFNLADDQYRKLIPALSFAPKQVIPTIKKVLNVFFGEGNPRVQVCEVNANEIVVQIPSSVPSLRRTLKGSLHYHAYKGKLTAIDNIGKTMTLVLENDTKILKLNELKDAYIGQGLETEKVAANGVGGTVTLQFYASADLSKFNTTDNVNFVLPNYPGSFIPDPRRPYSVTKSRGKLGQAISIGDISPTLVMQDASGIPDGAGYLVFGFGLGNEEGPVRYFSRPNNATLFIDPEYVFTKPHLIGEAVNVVVKPYQKPRTSGADYSVYFVGVTAARILAQKIVESITAAGVVIRWIVVDPSCRENF